MSAARTERLLNLLTLLLNTRRPISLREIRELEEFRAYRTADPKSGERAFERDKAALTELGVPLRWIPPEKDRDTEGEGGGYIIDRDKYYLPELNLEPSEVALLSIAGAAAVAMEQFPGRAAIIRALAKLGFDEDPEGAPAGLAHAPITSGGADRIGRNLEALHEAVAVRARVTLEYVGLGGQRTEREVDPYGLYYRQGVWYLVGYCHLRQDVRTFHLGRMLTVERTRGRMKAPPHFELPASFSLHEHAQRRPWEFPIREPQTVRIKLAPRLVPAIAEIFGPRARVKKLDRGAEVELTVTYPPALVTTVLPFGAAAEVLEPAELRAQLGDIYAELARRYGAVSPGGEA